MLLAFQDRIAEAVLGPDWAAGTPLVGLTPALLAGYGVFFLLGFALFALIYAAMGSFVSRPDDLQTLSLPLSLVAMVGYLTAIVALGGGGGTWVAVASFLPPFSPFVMLARIMVSAVQPWEVAAVDRAAGRGDRGRGGRRHPDVCRRRPALRPAARVARVRGGGAPGLTEKPPPRRSDRGVAVAGRCQIVSGRLPVRNRRGRLPDMPPRTSRRDQWRPRRLPAA